MKEMTDFQKKYFENLLAEEKEELAKNADIINSFRKFALEQGLYLTDTNFKYCQTIGIIATHPNILNYLHPNLISDKEGLLNFNILCQTFERRDFAEGYLYGENFMLMAHPYFRRGFHGINNFAPRFVELFWKYNNSKADKFISLDFDRVRINVDNTMYMELDTWYGAQFSKNIENISDGVVKLRPPLDLEAFDISFFFSSVYSLDIKWSTKDKIKAFQAEEFKTDDVKILKDNIEYYPVRYIHAEFDLEKGCFRHFDGAIHFYTADEYYSRRTSDFNYNSKNSNHIKTHSQKLFKLNGQVSVETWIELTSHFFTGNPLVFEYFEGEYPEHIKDVIEKLRNHRNN
jgi:hypothetical protein